MAEAIGGEDMVIVIVGEGPGISNTPRIKQKSVPVGFQSECVEKLLNDAITYGQFIEIKQENEEPYNIKIEINKEEDISGNETNKKKKIKTRTNKRSKTKRKHFSYIQKLRDENPEFVKSPSKLVEHLATMMKGVLPPQDPKDICTEIKDKDKTVYECNECEFRCNLYSTAVRHYRRYHGERYLTCYACGMDFSITDNLYKHEKKCQAADASIVLQARGRYLGVKGKSRPYTTKTKFLRYDAPKKRHQCSQCTKSFVLRVNRDAHERLHAGVRPYRCHRCPAAYTADYTLKRHLQTHTETQFVCDACGFSTKLRGSLVTHMAVHRPERRYGCHLCSRRYAQKQALTIHLNTHHYNLPPEHVCTVCAKRFVKIYNLKVHMENIHGLKMITRRMMFKSMPNLSDMMVTAVKVLKSEPEDEIDDSPAVDNVTQKVKEKGKNQAKLDANVSEKREIGMVTLPIDDSPRAVKKFLETIHGEAKPGCKVVAQEKSKAVNRWKSDSNETVVLSV